MVAGRGFATSRKPQVNPRTGEVFKEYTTMGADEVHGIVAATDQAYRQWSRVPAKERAGTMSMLAGKLRERADDAAALMNQEMGKPVPQGRAEVMKCAMLVDWYAEHGPAMLKDSEHPSLPGFRKTFVTYRPLGVILAIMPWNFPFWQVIRMAVPTIMAGNGVVLKHASNCFGSALMIEQLFGEVPDLPEGLFRSLVVGADMVEGVMEDPAVHGVAITGSTAAGTQVATKAGSLLKKCVVELGGSDPYVILDDADLDNAAAAVVNGRLLNTGQVCIAPKRVIVSRNVKTEFERKVLDKLSGKSYGTDFGPMVSAEAREEVVEQVVASQKAGARLLAGGADAHAPAEDSGKAFFAPTVLTDVKPGMVAFEKEIFGPVIAIVEAEDEKHAVQLANQSEFGLGGAVFTEDRAKGERIAVDEIDCGMCYVNDFVRSDPSLPFGGVKKSGLGRECSIFGLREFVNVKTICVK